MNQMAEHECQASTSETLHTRRQIHTAAVHGELSPTLPDCPRMSVEPARFHRLKAYLSEQHRVPAMPQRLTGTRTPQQAIDTGAPQRVPDAGLPKGFPGSGMPQRVTRDVSMPQSQRTAAPMQRRSGAPLFEHPRPAPPARQHTRSDTVSTVSTTAPSSLGLSGAHGYSSSMSSVGSGSTAAAAKTQLCRHCRQPVIGKSVSSRDGKLSGRYHPECFNCYVWQMLEFARANNSRRAEQHSQTWSFTCMTIGHSVTCIITSKTDHFVKRAAEESRANASRASAVSTIPNASDATIAGCFSHTSTTSFRMAACCVPQTS